MIYSCVIYIYMMYISCLQRWKTKKIEFFHFFAECHDHDTRQSWESRTPSFPALPSDMVKALGKENAKKKKTRFAERQIQALGKEVF